MPGTPRASDWLFWIALVACGMAVIIPIWNSPTTYQGDFGTYYYAARAFQQGLNPYEIGSLISASGDTGTNLRFVYPLSFLYVMRPLAAMDYSWAYHIWLGAKLIALAVLLVLWCRTFLRNSDLRIVAVVALLGFDAAMLWDLRSGNVSIFEQLFLWVGFSFFLRRRWGAFATCVVLASLTKIAPIVFLSLLGLPRLRTSTTVRTAAAAGIAVLAITMLSFVGHFDLLKPFWGGGERVPSMASIEPEYCSGLC